MYRRSVYCFGTAGSRWKDAVTWFGRSTSALCSAFMVTIDVIHSKINQKMQFDVALVQKYAEASATGIYRHTKCLDRCIGFIDGTVQPIARPTRNQRAAYNGHKRTHAIKFQYVILANGMIMSLTRPTEGRRHDVALLRASSIGEMMRAHCPTYQIYGDPVYPTNSWLIPPYRTNMTSDKEAFNKRMSAARVAVEWMFGEILRLWAFVDFKKQQKALLSPVEKLYIIAVFQTNCMSCFRQKNQGSETFGVAVPSIEEYLEGI